MACYQKTICPHCGSDHIIKAGTSAQGEQRYRCKNPDCTLLTFMQAYRYKAYKHGMKAHIVDMALNGSGVRDTARVLKVSRNTVMDTIKKACRILTINPNFRASDTQNTPTVRVERVCDEAELDEQWSYVGKKSNQRWLWYAVDHNTNTVLAFVFGKRKDDVFKQLKAMLEPFGIQRYYTDDWGAYERHLDTEQHHIGKQNTQKPQFENLD